ncbi:MAG: DUF6580 family putative transport protein [Burkholderiales bacterium]
MPRIRFVVFVGMILAAAASRLIPHPPNFASIGSVGPCSGALASPASGWHFSCPWPRC